MPPRPRDYPNPVLGACLGLSLVALTAALLVPFHDHVSRATPALVLLVPTIVAAIVGGRMAAVVTAVAGAVAFSAGFIPPVGSLRVGLPEDAVALGVFLVVAVVVGTLTAREGQRRRVAEERTREVAAMHVRLEALAAERARLAEEHSQLEVLQRVDEQRSALLRSVSHDLRTPLAAIRAIATDLRSGTEYAEGTRDELLDIVGDQAARLDRLVANLLSMSRIDAGALRLEREAVDQSELLAHVAPSFDALFRSVPVIVEVSAGLPLIWADYVQLEQVIINLVENAVRYSPPGSPVMVRAWAGAGVLSISVTDEGPGVDAADRGAIFEPFYTGSASRSSGVGLAICRAIVEAHDGRIDLQGTATGGACFVFTLPVVPAPVVPAPVVPAPVVPAPVDFSPMGDVA